MVSYKKCDPQYSIKTVGEQRRAKKPGFNQICENAIQRRKKTREIWLQDTQNEEEFIRYKIRLKEASRTL